MQHRKAWCRGCGGQGSYATGWVAMRAEDVRALEDSLGRSIGAVRGPRGGGDGVDAASGLLGLALVRLRVRHLKCVHCQERGLLVAGLRPVRPLTSKDAARPH